MVHTRSDARTFAGAVAAVGAVAAGVMALSLGALFAAPRGLRPALVVAEIALALPAVLVGLMFGGAGRLVGGGSVGRGLVARALLAGAALWLLSLGLMDVQARLWPPPAGYLEAFRSLHAQLRPAGPLDALLSVAVIALLPALCEELVFRGLVLPAFRALGGAGVGLGVSSLLFGLIHLDQAGSGLTAYRVPFAIVVGLGFGLLRLRTDTLVAPVLAHAALNTLTFAAVPLLDEPAQDVTLPNPALGMALAVAGALALWRLMRRAPGDAPAAASPPAVDWR